MKTFQLVSTTFALSSVLALAGCPKDNSAMTAEDYDDVAVAMGSLIANSSGGEMGSVTDSIELSQGSGSSLKAVTGVSAHEVIIRAGLTYEYFVDCLDTAGATQTACDPATTNSASIAVNWRGDLAVPRYSASITRTGEWTLTGLQTAEAELNGTGSFDLVSHFEALNRPVTKDLSLSYNAEYSAVKVDLATKLVTSGSITYEIQGSRNVERPLGNRAGEFSLDAEVTFDGAGNATLVLDTSRSYTINLTTGAVAQDQ